MTHFNFKKLGKKANNSIIFKSKTFLDQLDDESKQCLDTILETGMVIDRKHHSMNHLKNKKRILGYKRMRRAQLKVFRKLLQRRLGIFKKRILTRRAKRMPFSYIAHICKNKLLVVTLNVYTEKLKNYIMKEGKKANAEKIFLKIISDMHHLFGRKSSFKVLVNAFMNASPLMSIKSVKLNRRKKVLVPQMLTTDQRYFLGIKNIVKAARDNTQKLPFNVKLAKEIILASQNKGTAIQIKMNLNKLAFYNKAQLQNSWRTNRRSKKKQAYR